MFFFFHFKYLCKLIYILLYWFNKFIIFSQLLTCANALKHSSYITLVSWATFFFPKFWIVATVPSGTIATVATVPSGIVATVATIFIYLFINNRFVFIFVPFKYLCKWVYILLYWHNKFHNIFIIINVPISYKSK